MALNLWQAKHDKKGVSSKFPHEFQWEIGEIAKSLREWRTLTLDFKLPIENEKTLLEKKTDVAVYLEININCWEWEIIVWKKEITMRDQILVFLSRWATASQQNVFWQEVLSFLRRTRSLELGVAIRTATASTS